MELSLHSTGISDETRNPFQKPIGNVALNSGRPHRFGRAYQHSFSERLKQAKSNNLKRSNFRQSVLFLSADALEQESGRGRIKIQVTNLNFTDFFAISGL